MEHSLNLCLLQAVVYGHLDFKPLGHKVMCLVGLCVNNRAVRINSWND